MTLPPRERDTLSRQYRRQFQRKLQVVIDREVKSLTKAIEQDGSIENIYLRQVPSDLKRIAAPSQWAFADAIIDAAARETGLPMTPTDAVLVKFIDSYVKVFRERHVSSHLAQLQSLDSIEQVQTRISEWKITAAGKYALDESVRMNQGTFREAIFSQNMAVYWRTRGPSTCPFCKRLEGKRVTKRNPWFVKKGGQVDVDDEQPMKIYHGCGHPSLHQNCDCYVSI